MFCFKKIANESGILYERHTKNQFGDCIPHYYGECANDDVNIATDNNIINTSHIYTATIFEDGTGAIQIFDDNGNEKHFMISNRSEVKKILKFINNHLCKD